MIDARAVVVGIDDSDSSQLALDWAVDEARERRIPLRIVSIYSFTPLYVWGPVYSDPETQDYVRGAAVDRVDAAAARVAELAPDLDVKGIAVEGDAANTLIQLSEEAAEIVLGSRQMAALGSAFLGSVSCVVAARAACPVTVLRGPSGMAAEGAEVVVGVDGTESAEVALEYAFDHASRFGVPLKAVLCWKPDPLATMKWRGEPPAPEKADRFLAEITAGWQEKYPDVDVRRAVIRDHPVEGLIAESHGSRVLVVGTHSRHAVTGALLGSVAQGVLHHATCPVTVIPVAMQ
jgi:nucleotide-binding universal stress UspA family protein